MAAETRKRAAIRGKLITPHYPACVLFNGQNNHHFPWCCPETKRLQAPGHKRERWWMVFRCADTGCPAHMAILEYQWYALIENGLKHLWKLGAPKCEAAARKGHL